jgi:bifunctional enzyme CysN/CysC
VILVDARKGLLEQSRRHAFLATLLRVPHLVLAVNKMDLVRYDAGVFARIRAEFAAFAARLDVGDLAFIPVSALHGDNIVQPSAMMPWYDGPPLLTHLENVHIASDRNLTDVRFPVQFVIRDHASGYRGYAGQVAGGVLKPGDEVTHLPSGITTRITRIDTADGPVDRAYPPMSVTLLLADDLDVSRGDMVCRPGNRPVAACRLDATVCWMAADRELAPGDRLVLKHTTTSTRAVVEEVRYRLDVNSLHRDESAGGLAVNEIGRLSLRLTAPVFADRYRRNRHTGGFILIDETTNATVGAGTILGLN